jgi:hypothetical protein
MSSPEWTDDELLRELRAALQESTVEESVIQAAQAAFTWRTVDTELELLSLAAGAALTEGGRAEEDTLTKDTLAEGALVRGGGQSAPRTLVFHGERLSVEVEIDEAGIVGQLMPPRPGVVTLVTAAGPQATAQADEVGCFTFPPPRSGPLRLDCRLGADHFITDWVTV